MIARWVARMKPALRGGVTVLGWYAGFALVLLLSMASVRALGDAELAARLPWYLSRAAAVTAYLLLTGSTLLGLVISTRLATRQIARPSVMALHEHLAWLALVATGLHVGTLLADSTIHFGIIGLLVPFAAPYRPVAVALGSIAFYLSIAVTASFYVRARIGQRVWRALHMSTFGLYALATAHGVLAGSSSSQPWMQWIYLGSGAAVLFLTNYRILLDRRAAQQRRTARVPATSRAAGDRTSAAPSAGQ